MPPSLYNATTASLSTLAPLVACCTGAVANLAGWMTDGVV
jgi:citrate synthase